MNKKFRISSALKDIIGRELITNDFIAVFELVKNAFDAQATKVDITFNDLSSANPSLIIQDNGKGMDLKDFEDKWLFVAYSAKKDGSEDYRDKIKSVRIHAGAKGIGRFSCDRLGTSLQIYSRKATSNQTINKLSVNWEDFEADAQAEFEDISVAYEEVGKSPYDLKAGTVLEINFLREKWDREKLLKLRRSLEKLINPNQDNDSANFSINLFAPEYESSDASIDLDEPWNKVNGPVENFLFERLGLSTTFINVRISEDGGTIRTRLEDRGTSIFEIVEQNKFTYDDFKLKDIEVSLFALNQGAKASFTKYMGTRPVNFGSVFVYKNGFRIHPMGEFGDDSLGLDSRKTQGTSRFLGSRDVLGRIEINGENPDFKEASSRDGGLVRNDAYDCLREFFLFHVLKRLEGYAVDIVKYGNLGEDFDSALNQDTDLRSKILSLIQTLTKSPDIIDVKYDPEVVNILEELSEKSVQELLRNFRQIAERTSSHSLESEVLKAEDRLRTLNLARREAEAEAALEQEARKKAEREALKERERTLQAEAEAELAKQNVEAAKQTAEKSATENLFLRTMVGKDIAEVVSFHHHIGIAAETIENYVKDFSKRIRKGQSYNEATILDALESISKQSRKILATTRFATKANFTLEGSNVTTDLCGYLEEYMLNICDGVIKTFDKKNMIFVWENPGETVFEATFRPLEVAIVLDNLISNSRKARARTITARVVSIEDNILIVRFSDDGRGLTDATDDRLFDLGFTSTDGSGLGLSQTKEIMERSGGSIGVDRDFNAKGAAFLLGFKK